MGRKIFYVENIDAFEDIRILWHDDSDYENREKMWALSDKLRALIEDHNVGLSDKQKQCIMWYIDGLTFTEMGNRLNISHTWARTHFVKGVKKIKSFLKNSE